MKLLSLIPTIFYSDLRIGKRLFVDALGFTIAHEDQDGNHPLCIVKNGTLKVYLVLDKELASMDRPEIRIVTNDIEEVYRFVQNSCPEILHPNLNTIKSQPWGLKEFALLDESGACVIIQQ